MAARESVGSIRQTARVTGALILVLVVLGPFSLLYVPSTVVVPGDAAATASNIAASEGLFRLGLVSDSAVFLIEIAIVALLYVLLRPVSRTLSLIAAFARLAMAVVQGVNLFNHLFPLALLSGADYLSVFQPNQLNALVMLFLDVHKSGTLVWGLFFGLHLVVLGYLVYRSGYIPGILGALLVVAGVCYLVQSFGNLLAPTYGEILTFIGFLSIVEVAFPIWLVIKGVNAERWQERASESI